MQCSTIFKGDYIMAVTNSFSYAGLFAKNAADAKPLGMGKRGKYDFAVAYPDPTSIPVDELAESLQTALNEEGGDLALYAHPQGYAPLRQFIANKLERDRNINVSPDEIIIGSGSSQPIHMIIEMNF